MLDPSECMGRPQGMLDPPSMQQGRTLGMLDPPYSSGSGGTTGFMRRRCTTKTSQAEWEAMGKPVQPRPRAGGPSTGCPIACGSCLTAHHPGSGTPDLLLPEPGRHGEHLRRPQGMLDPPSIDCGLQERPLGMLDPSVCKAAGSCHMERHSGYGGPLSSMANFDQSDVEFSGSEDMERDAESS